MQPLPDLTKHAQIYSVQHTGSRFIKQVLLDHGWDFCDVKHYQIPYLNKGLCISPIRDPKDTYVSWVSRGRTENFFQTWYNFNQTYLYEGDIWVVPIDTPDRDEYLELLSNRLRCKLETDWNPVGSQPHKEVKEIDLSAIYALPVVKQFYSE